MAKKHEMPQLPYAKDALAPHISSETIDYHYGKHLKAYVDKLNDLVPGTQFEDSTLEEIIKKAEGPIFNNGAQVWNHTFYFDSFRPDRKSAEPKGALREAIDKEFGSFDNFKAEFEKQATGLFGAGWTWLVKDGSKLKIVNESNAGNPIRNGQTPVMTMDVWEHAYYIDYRNKRADSIKATWNVIDWDIVGKRFDK